MKQAPTNAPEDANRFFRDSLILLAIIMPISIVMLLISAGDTGGNNGLFSKGFLASFFPISIGLMITAVLNVFFAYLIRNGSLKALVAQMIFVVASMIAAILINPIIALYLTIPFAIYLTPSSKLWKKNRSYFK